MEVGKEVTKCGVVVLMEVTQPQVGVRTRARAMAVVTEETADNSGDVKGRKLGIEKFADNSGDVKRRKLGNEKLRSPSSTFVQTKILDGEVHVQSVQKEKRNNYCDAAGSRRSSGVPASCCSSTRSIEKLQVSDLEESVETGTTARSEFNAEPGELESTAAKQSTVTTNSFRTVLPAGRMPPESELEEFFAAAQGCLNERFKNKYNYDIVNDIPLKGRFEWIQVKPQK